MTGPSSANPLGAAPRDDDDDDDLVDVDITGDEAEDEDGPTPAKTWRRPSRRRWVLFAAIALAVLLVDQLTKAAITGNLAPGQSVDVLGSWLRFVYWTNSGILFGMLPQSGPAFAIVSIGVIGLIGLYHAKAGRGLVTTVALGLLLGGALGNLVDRLRYGAVVDWVDMGIGQWRFYTYNMGDAAITTAITLLLLMAVFPRLADWAAE
jgi:signal peptidase II